MMAWLGRALVAVLGFCFGAILLALALYLWPFAFQDRSDEAIAEVGKADRIESFFLEIPGDSVLGTHGGAFPFKSFPEGIRRLGDGHTPNTFALVSKFRDARHGEIVAFGTELEIAHPDSSLLRGRLMTHTLWSIVVPGRGTLHLYQTENNWRLLKKVILPMLLSGKPYAGAFDGVNTVGPLPHYQGRVLGGTGEFAKMRGTFIEIGELRGMQPDGALDGSMELRVGMRRDGG